MTSVAVTLAEWAAGLEPDREDLELAHRSLLDTVAVTLAARDHRVTRLAATPAGGGALGRGRARARLRRPAHAVHHARQRGLRADALLRHGRRGAGLPGRGRGDGPAGHGAGLAALLGRLARHLHGRGAGRGRRGGRRAGPAGRADRGGHGAGRARRGRGAARLRHRRQVAAGRLRRRGRDPGGPARGRGRAGRPGGAGRVAGPGGRRSRPRWTRRDRRCRTGWRSSSTRAATRCSARSARCPGFPPTRRRSAGSCCAPRRPRWCR